MVSKVTVTKMWSQIFVVNSQPPFPLLQQWVPITSAPILATMGKKDDLGAHCCKNVPIITVRSIKTCSDNNLCFHFHNNVFQQWPWVMQVALFLVNRDRQRDGHGRTDATVSNARRYPRPVLQQ